MLKVGEPIPSFTLMSEPAGEVSTQKLLGKRYVIFVYPKDDTFGWTVEATEFRDRIPEFQKLDVLVYGLSPDDLVSHHKFAEKHQLNFPLLADVDRAVIDAMGLWGEQEWNDKKFMGVFRTTMIVGPDGRIEQLWEKVKFQDHAEQVLTALKQIQT